MASLRAVEPGEKPPVKGRKKTVAEAAAGGDERELLVAMRDRIAKAVSSDDCPPRDLASLTKRLAEVAEAIKALDAAAKESDGDSDEGDPGDAYDASAV